jgi:putative endonuclease
MKITDLFVYILLCDNGAFYTGYTTNLARRYAEHQLGIKCKFTRSFKPLRVEHCWKIKGDKSTAMMIERYIKQLSKKDKQQLINSPESLQGIFPEFRIDPHFFELTTFASHPLVSNVQK